MTRLVWDDIGRHFYETGLDHGVLYFPVSGGVAWSGLISVEENLADDTSPLYFDGIKTSNYQSTGDFSAVLTAFVYPDEFLQFEGMKELGPGFYVSGQSQRTFGLSYRTFFGNDILGVSYGYRLHLLYNLTVIPEPKSYNTTSDTVDPTQFSWTVTGVPDAAPNYVPTAHLILDSRLLNANTLASIEDILYGESTEPRLPPIAELLTMVLGWEPMLIIPNSLTGIAQLSHAPGDLTPSSIAGIYVALPATRLTQTATPGIYQLP